MKIFISILSILFLCTFLGCETVHDGTKKVGNVVGKGADAFGGLTEGAAEGMQGDITPEENPYGR